MTSSPDINPSTRNAFDACLDVEPPAALRDRVLTRHRRRRRLQRSAPVLVLAVIGVVSMLLMHSGSTPPADTDWQQRSAQLEAAWREAGDPAWLRDDARAQALLRQLRRVDQALSQSYAHSGDDPMQRGALWRERSETLSALLHSRQQGGIAVRL